jgi:hypothetical protein
MRLSTFFGENRIGFEGDQNIPKIFLWHISSWLFRETADLRCWNGSENLIFWEKKVTCIYISKQQRQALPFVSALSAEGKILTGRRD